MATFSNFYVEALDRPVKVRMCDCPGCSEAGEHRAPKSRDQLNEYYWFCLDHVRDYNQHWDYFAGMSSDEIADHVKSAGVWDRPSWPLGQWRENEQKLRDHVAGEFFAEGFAPGGAADPAAASPSRQEREALAVLEMSAPADFTAIKAQYRVMVKRHHPDLHGGSVEAEEKFKCINLAFTVLRQFYGDDNRD